MQQNVAHSVGNLVLINLRFIVVEFVYLCVYLFVYLWQQRVECVLKTQLNQHQETGAVHHSNEFALSSTSQRSNYLMHDELPGRR